MPTVLDDPADIFAVLIDDVDEELFLDRVEDFELVPDNRLRHQPNFALRALKELHITFTRKA